MGEDDEEEESEDYGLRLPRLLLQPWQRFPQRVGVWRSSGAP